VYRSERRGEALYGDPWKNFKYYSLLHNSFNIY
jgi:hypothetical protein